MAIICPSIMSLSSHWDCILCSAPEITAVSTPKRNHPIADVRAQKYILPLLIVFPLLLTSYQIITLTDDLLPEYPPKLLIRAIADDQSPPKYRSRRKVSLLSEWQYKHRICLHDPVPSASVTASGDR